MRRAVLLTIPILFALGASVAVAGRGDYVGSATCGSCHPAVLASWQKTAHARSATALGAKPTPRCLSCHGTGDAPAGRTYFAEVGCEACHGAGAAYATDDIMRDRPLALALGLADLTQPPLRAAICARCHGATTTRLRPVDLSRRAHP